MFIGVYLCGSGFVLGITLLFLMAGMQAEAKGRQIKKQFATFLLKTVSLILICLVLFTTLSIGTGILPAFGNSGSYNLPQDYLAYGLFGWLILVIGLVGIFSPVFTAVWLHRHRKI